MLLGPHVSEKATALADSATPGRVQGPRATPPRPTCGARSSCLFEVKVERVTVARMPAKTKRFGQRQGKRGGWKKAYVRLAPGSDINFMGAE